MDFSIFSIFGNKLEASSAIFLEVSALSFAVFSISCSAAIVDSSRTSSSRSSLIRLKVGPFSFGKIASSASVLGRTSSSDSNSISGVANKSNRMIESSAMSLVSSSKLISPSLFSSGIVSSSFLPLFLCQQLLALHFLHPLK